MTVHSSSRRTFLRSAGIALSASMLPSLARSGSRRPYQTIETHRILSCNIRVALDTDEQRGFGWSTRRDVCIEVIRSYEPDIVCTQEVLRIQNEDLKQALSGFQSHGFDGPEMLANPDGYHFISKNVIYFNRSRYDQVSAGGFWLSETPHLAASKSWGTARARQINWVWLRDKHTRAQFRVLDVHLDHLEQEARMQQVRMLLREADLYPSEFPQILAGDFNVDRTNTVYREMSEAEWHDTHTEKHGDADPGFTFHEFRGRNFPSFRPPERIMGKIDFIFRKGNVRTIDASVIRDEIGGIYPSDHYFVLAELSLPGDLP